MLFTSGSKRPHALEKLQPAPTHSAAPHLALFCYPNVIICPYPPKPSSPSFSLVYFLRLSPDIKKIKGPS